MRSFLLFLTCILIWGTTWLAIKFQVADVVPEISVFYRFAMASALLFLIAFVRRRSLRFSGRDHIWLMALGFIQFSLNFKFTYHAEALITSGLVAFAFTLVPYLNILWLALFFHQRTSRRVLWASALGAIGIFLIFQKEFANFSGSPIILKGFLFALSAAFCSSMSSLIVRRNSFQSLPVFESNAWSMLYGALLSLVFIFGEGHAISFSFEPKYIYSLFYLAILGSVIAYAAYFRLIHYIGIERAAYVNVITPVIALIISSFFEGFQWQISTFIGVIFCIFGNYLVLS